MGRSGLARLRRSTTALYCGLETRTLRRVAEPSDNGETGPGTTYRVRLLADTPAESDEFAAKAHERVASAIASLIVGGDGGKVIGLEGLWGSGKSTVVQLVRETLKSGQAEATTRVVVFDAWAHQGDPLRRTFLEAVIRELRAADWIDANTARSAVDELTGHSSHVTTTSTSRLSFEGKLAAGATVLLALGAAFFGNHFSHYHRLFLAIGGVLLIAPLLVVLGLWIVSRAGRYFAAANRQGVWARMATLDPSSFFAKDLNAETVTTGVQQGEPTSVEFERIFSRILDAGLTEGRLLVLVLDNLDRVDEDDARKVLSTMQTFTAPTHSPDSWAARVWTLIPYDAAGLEKLWLSADSTLDPSPTDVPRLNVASAFLDKLFQVRFETPPLVLSDWRGYTLRLLHEALPDEANENLEAVLRLRGLYPSAVPNSAVAAETPTPRQLKQFVNQIGAIRRQRDDVPLVHIAYYVLLRRDSVNLRRALLDGDVPNTKLAHLFHASVREDVAALHFGAEGPLAQQLLLGPAIEAAFAGGRSDVVEGLRDRPGFVDALEGHDFEARAADGGIELTRAVAVLGRSGALGVEAVKPWASAVLDPIAEQTAMWRVQGRETGEGLAILLNRVSAGSDEKLNELLARIAQAPVEADTEGQGQLQGLAGLVDELTNLGRVADSIRVTLDIPAARLVDSLAFLGGQVQQPKSTRVVELATNPSDVAGALVEAVTSDRIAQAQGALEMLLFRLERVDLGALASGSIEWLRANEPASREQLGLLLAWLDRARRHLDPATVLDAAADDGTLLHLVAVAMANAWYAEAAGASMLHLVARPELPDLPPELPDLPSPTRQAPTGLVALREALSTLAPAELVAAQLEWLTSHSREAFQLVAGISKAPSSQPWVDNQMRALSDAGVLVTSAAQFLTNWGYLRRVLGPDHFRRHSRQLLDKEPSREKILGGLTDPQRALDALAAAEDGEAAPYLGEVESGAAALVQAATPEEWVAAVRLTETDPLLALALRLVGTSAAPKNPNGLQEALHAHFQALAEEGEAWQPGGPDFEKLTRLLGAPARRVLASQLCAELEGRDGQVGPGLFPTYGDFLGDEPAFRTHAKLPNVIERFVARDQWPVVSWFVGLANRERDALDDKGRADEMEHLKETVADKIRLAGEAAPEELRQLGALFGLSVEAPTPPAEPDDT
jgi:hypothetical protein